ncbi:unnamed protein product [Cylicostephanus goldi]|uniref:Uncharacterized protein n=1 Tax=Cylicostephanus goldi TaxID=71465 RepID=A0A3P7MJC3_CYLGO|nr:unnamed protein product [Cylicostephanus goldi]
MGKRSRLPDYQLNVAESNTETEDLPEQAVKFQATELVRRLHSIMTPYELGKKWMLLVIATGTEENEFNSLKYATFGVLAIARLPIHSREPESLLVPGKPLLNRKGHTYAAKWLWNRLLAGPTYNFSNVVFSEDSYFCPSVVSRIFDAGNEEGSKFLFHRSSPKYVGIVHFCAFVP